MNLNNPNKIKQKIPKTKKFKNLRLLSIIIGTLLIISIVSSSFISRLTVPDIQAEETLMCLKICEAGVENCDFGVCANLPSLTTQAVTDITQTTATGNGTVVADGGDAITERGIVVSTSINPTISDTKFITTGTTGVFTTSMTGLSAGTTYYVRAYATNGVGTNYGPEVSFTTLAEDEDPEEVEQESGWGGSGATKTGDKQTKTKDDSDSKIKQVPPPPLAELKKYLIIKKEAIGEVAEIKAEIKMDFLVDSQNKSTNITKETRNIGVPTVSNGSSTTFRGTTNIKDARIILSLRSRLYRGTTYADSQGNWEWTIAGALEIGYHILEVQAISPYHLGVKSEESYEFQVVHEVPSQSDTSKPVPVIIHTPLSLKDIYILNLDIIIPDKGLVSTNQLDVRTDITSFDPATTEAFKLKYILYNAQGEQIYEQKKEVVVKDQISDISRLITSSALHPGDYLATVELTKDEQIYIASHKFTIEPLKLIITPVTITAQQAQIGLLMSAVILYLFLLLLIYLLYKEYRKIKLAFHQVTGEDLLKGGTINS